MVFRYDFDSFLFSLFFLIITCIEIMVGDYNSNQHRMLLKNNALFNQITKVDTISSKNGRYKTPIAYIVMRFCFYRSQFSFSAGSPEEMTTTEAVPAAAAPVSTVIPGADSLIGDLLDMDLGPPMHQMPNMQQPQQQSTAAMDLLGEGLDSLVS